jgi:hypothetical protein
VKLVTPMKIITIRQPWAHLIVSGSKNIENRNWVTSYRGPVLIHAGLAVDRRACMEYGLAPDDLDRGAVIGIANIVDCVRRHSSRWFVGPFGFVLRDRQKIRAIAWKGALGLPEAPSELLNRLDKRVLRRYAGRRSLPHGRQHD